MKVTIKYFGSIAETAGKDMEVLEVDNLISVGELKQLIIEKYHIQDAGSVQVAVNHELETNTVLEDGDTVAFLPPFAGG